MARMMAAHPTPEQFEDLRRKFWSCHTIKLCRAGRIGSEAILYSVSPWRGGYRVLSCWADVVATFAVARHLGQDVPIDVDDVQRPEGFAPPFDIP